MLFSDRSNAHFKERCVIYLLTLWLLEVGQGYSALASVPDDARMILRGVLDQRERLRSGQVRIHGRRLGASLDGQPFESDVSIRYEFDVPASLLRIDWDEPVQELQLSEKLGVEDVSKEKLMDLARFGEMKAQRRVSKFVHTPQYSLNWMSNNERVVLQHAPEQKTQHLHLQRFDIRALGFMCVYDFDNGTVLNEIGNNLMEQKIVDCAALNVTEGNLDRITWVFGPHKDLKRDIFVDRQHGYTPLHFAIRERTPGGDIQSWQESPIEAIDVTWKEISGVWVPVSYVQRRLSDKKILAQLEMILDWESVNSQLDAKDFTYQELDVPVKAQVVSDQLGKQVLVGYAYPKGQDPLTNIKGQSTAQSGRSWLLYCNIVFIVAIILVLIQRRWRASAR